jgi:inosose dehydratase
MPKLLVGNAPCSWGALEFEEAKGEKIGYSRMLDELAETGYTGTELGDWGYMPTDPAALRGELERRGLVMLGAFVPVALRNRQAHDAGTATAVRTARLLAAVGSSPEPFLVLADDNGSVPVRTRLAGRIPAEAGLGTAEWNIFAAGADRVARAVLEETGLKTVFHHHCAGYVETPQEIGRFLELTDPQKMGLVFDTGHFTYGAARASLVDALNRFGNRIWYVHFKDCDAKVAARARAEEWDYFTALRHGLFCELGKGSVDFPAVLRWLAARRYQGYLLVEQDVLPGMGAPRDSARRNREYLRSVESNFEECYAHTEVS